MRSPPSKRRGRWQITSHPIPDLQSSFSRVILVVLDSVGCGELPDAASYGDQGSDTLGNIARHVPLRLPRLRALGLDRVSAIGAADPPGAERRPGAYGRMAEMSAGKDSVRGHWEMRGIVLDRPFPTFPQGFALERKRV